MKRWANRSALRRATLAKSRPDRPGWLRLPRPAPAVAWFPAEGYLLTGPMIRGLVDHAVRQGATVITGEPGRVTGFEAGRDSAGPGWAVSTAAGQLIPADVVVCCAGTQVPRLA